MTHVTEYGPIGLHDAPSGSIWHFLASYGHIRANMATYGNVCAHIGPYGFVWHRLPSYGPI